MTTVPMRTHLIRCNRASLLAVLSLALACTVAADGARAQGWFDRLRQAPPEPAAAAPQQSPEVAELSLRVDRLEELVRRLNGEIEMLRHRLGEDGAAPVAAASPPATATPPAASPQPLPPTAYDASAPGYGGGGVGAPTSLLPPRSTASAASPPPVPGAPERPLGTIPASALRGTDDASPSAPAPAGETGQTVAALDAAVVEEAYSRAYQLLVEQDYAGAETEFRTFLSRYPGHELAGNAQYWLAETYYARGQYRQAAKEFLAGFETYGSSTKAPDSLLKLGMTLAALGQNSQACASLNEVATRFPNADPGVLERARSERQRVGC